MPPDLRNSRKRIFIRPHGIDGLLSSSGNAVVIAIALIRTVGSVIGPFQLRKIHVLTWNVLNGRIVRFPKRRHCPYQPLPGLRPILRRELDSAGWKSGDPDPEA